MKIILRISILKIQKSDQNKLEFAIRSNEELTFSEKIIQAFPDFIQGLSRYLN